MNEFHEVVWYRSGSYSNNDCGTLTSGGSSCSTTLTSSSSSGNHIKSIESYAKAVKFCSGPGNLLLRPHVLFSGSVCRNIFQWANWAIFLMGVVHSERWKTAARLYCLLRVNEGHTFSAAVVTDIRLLKQEECSVWRAESWAGEKKKKKKKKRC